MQITNLDSWLNEALEAPVHPVQKGLIESFFRQLMTNPVTVEAWVTSHRIKPKDPVVGVLRKLAAAAEGIDPDQEPKSAIDPDQESHPVFSTRVEPSFGITDEAEEDDVDPGQ